MRPFGTYTDTTRTPSHVAETARASGFGKPGGSLDPATTSSSPTRERIATPFQAASPWPRTRSRARKLVAEQFVEGVVGELGLLQAHDVGPALSSHGSSRGSRCLTELTFQVAIRTCYGSGTPRDTR